MLASTATFSNGSTIDINISTSSTNIALIKGTVLSDVITTAGGLTIDGILNVTDNSTLVNFGYVQNGNNLDFNVVKAATILDTTIAGEGQNPARNTAKILDLISDNSSSYPQMTSIIIKLNELTSDKNVANSVNSTTLQSTTSTQIS